jgi:hypothetical protein
MNLMSQSSASCASVLVAGFVVVQRLDLKVGVSTSFFRAGIMITACDRAVCSFTEFIFHILYNDLSVLIPSTYYN